METRALTPTVFHILLALGGSPRHGYDILKQVAGDTEGRVRIAPGTLYNALRRLVEARHLRVAPQRQQQGHDLLLGDRPALADGHRAHLRPRVAASCCPVFPYSNAAVNRRP